MPSALLSLLILLAALLAPAAAQAQAPAAKPEPGLTAAQAQQVLGVLRYDRRRAEFIATLDALARAAPAATTSVPADPAPATPASAPTGPLVPDSLGAQLLVQASGAVSAAMEQVASSVRAVNDLPLLRRWIAAQAADPEARARIVDAAWKLAVVLGAALAAEWLSIRALNRLRAALARWSPAAPPPPADPVHAKALAVPEALDPPEESGLAAAEAGETERSNRSRRLSLAWRTLRRLPFVLARLLLDLAPVAVFALVGNLLLGTALGEPAATRPAILAVVNAYVLCRIVMCVTRMLVAPATPQLRLLHVSQWSADFVTKWVRRITVVAVFGYALAEAGLLFGMYRTAHDALLKLFSLAVHGFLVIAVLQARTRVCAHLRAPPGGRGAVAVLRNLVADTWHLVAIFYIAALWLVYAVEVRDGYTKLLHFFVVTSAALIVARLAAIIMLGGLDRALRIGPETAARYPGLEERANFYYPILRTVLGVALAALTGVAVLTAWGFEPLTWFETGRLGRRAVSALLLIGFTLAAAVVVWEGADAAIERHLAKLTRDLQLGRAGRLRTLLPMLRTALLVAIALIVALMLLSELGVNIAPLLAGAGVIGIAVGFGSQKLVQDLITGLFLLLENAMQVGDVVTLGGLSGTVEALSIRTIRLRALDGSVHIIPFSAVTTVTNQTRDYSYAVLDVAIGLNEEPDRISAVLRDIARALREDPAWRAKLTEDLDIMGVEKLTDTAWILRVRIKTLPASRWAVTRELNERIKVRFDAQAIESPFTSHRALSLGQPPAAKEAAA